MKTYNLLIWSALVFFVISVYGCEKQEPDGYTGKPGIYFNGKEFSYSFTENPGRTIDTILLPVLVSGQIENHNRSIKAVAVADSTTATNAMYTILDGYVNGGEKTGFLPMVVKYVSDLDDEIVKVKVQLVENEDFQELDLVYPSCKVTFTAKIIKPFNWSELELAFGAYSTSWWKFIMEKLGRSSLPYWDDFSPIPNPDPEKYNISYYEMSNIQQMIRLELADYNKTSTKGPLKHDDGEYEGQEVVMPAPF